LLQQGYTVVSCGWQHNVPQGTGRLLESDIQAIVDASGHRYDQFVQLERVVPA
jgi:hypothetical protein